MYDKYRDSGKAAGRPSRPMYAAVVLAMSGHEDEEGDESDCKQRLQAVTTASQTVWGGDAPDKRKIWDSLLVLLRIVPLRGPQDNLAGSVLTRYPRVAGRFYFRSTPSCRDRAGAQCMCTCGLARF